MYHETINQKTQSSHPLHGIKAFVQSPNGLPDAVQRLDQAGNARSFYSISNVCLHTAQLQPRSLRLCTARTAGFFFWMADGRIWALRQIIIDQWKMGAKKRKFTSFRNFPLADTSMEGKAEFAISLARMSNMNLHIPINILLTCHSRCIYIIVCGPYTLLVY